MIQLLQLMSLILSSWYLGFCICDLGDYKFDTNRMFILSVIGMIFMWISYFLLFLEVTNIYVYGVFLILVKIFIILEKIESRRLKKINDFLDRSK